MSRLTRGTGRPNPSREARFSGANGDKETQYSFSLFSSPRAGLATIYPVDPNSAESAVLTLHTYTLNSSGIIVLLYYISIIVLIV